MKNKYYKPLPENLTIQKSEVHGLGLFALEKILKETDLGVSHIFHVDFVDEYIRTPLGGFVNYSETPNCEIKINVDGYNLVTLYDIEKGEELTLKYNLYNPTDE